MIAYTIIKTSFQTYSELRNIAFSCIKYHGISPIYYLSEYFTHWYCYTSTKKMVLDTLRTYYITSFNANMWVLDLQHETLYFLIEPEYVDIEHSLPFEITDYYSEETTEERLAHYMIKNNLIDSESMKFKNFCELCDAWDQIYINTPNYIVLYQRTTDGEILLATFDTEQEALDFITTK